MISSSPTHGDVAHATLVEEPAVGLAARARCRVQANRVLQVVADEEVVLLEDRHDQVARSPAPHGLPVCSRSPLRARVLARSRRSARPHVGARSGRVRAPSSPSVLLGRMIAAIFRFSLDGSRPDPRRRVRVRRRDVSEEQVHVGFSRRHTSITSTPCCFPIGGPRTVVTPTPRPVGEVPPRRSCRTEARSRGLAPDGAPTASARRAEAACPRRGSFPRQRIASAASRSVDAPRRPRLETGAPR